MDYVKYLQFNPLCDNAPYFIILLCLMSDDITHQFQGNASYGFMVNILNFVTTTQ